VLVHAAAAVVIAAAVIAAVAVKGAVIVVAMTAEEQITAAAAVPATNRGVAESRIIRRVAGSPRLTPVAMAIGFRLGFPAARHHGILKFHSGQTKQAIGKIPATARRSALFG
jgi:hypothetical protein